MGPNPASPPASSRARLRVSRRDEARGDLSHLPACSHCEASRPSARLNWRAEPFRASVLRADGFGMAARRISLSLG